MHFWTGWEDAAPSLRSRSFVLWVGVCLAGCSDASSRGQAVSGGATGFGGSSNVDASMGGMAGDSGATGGTAGGSTALAATPPMGWNSWNKFQNQPDETLIKAIADAMVSSGMKAAGYQYVNIDDGWSQKQRDPSGTLVPDSERFPSGIKALADYVHSKGLKLGIYGDRGTETCTGYPGSYDHETQDAQTFADWGIDYLKYDNCAIPSERSNEQAMQEDYGKMASALKATGRPIVFSICAWRFRDWMPSVAHLWRTGPDINDHWLSDRHSLISVIDKNGGDTSGYGVFSDASNPEGAFYDPPGVAAYAGPGHWNDPDALEVGNGGMTAIEYRSHFSLWAIMAAPLITGNDLRNMDQATLDILLNDEVIAVDQDPLGRQGKPISESTQQEVWSKPLSGDRTYAVILFNRATDAVDISVTWSQLGLLSSTALVRDLWDKKDLGSVATRYQANVPGHGVVMLKVVGQ